MIGGLLAAVAPYLLTVVAVLAVSAGVHMLVGPGWALIVVGVGALLLDYQREHHRTRR